MLNTRLLSVICPLSLVVCCLCEAERPVVLLPDMTPLPNPLDVANISIQHVFRHVMDLIQISDLEIPYETSRAKAREYIVNALTSTSDGPGFTGEQVLYHKFDWTDTTIGSSQQYITTSWSGVNILAWTNTSELPEGSKFSVIAAPYDSAGWWSKERHGNTYPCKSESPEACWRGNEVPSSRTRKKALSTSLDLLGTAILLQLAKAVANYHKTMKATLESKNALELLYYWDKSNPKSIQTGTYEEVPIVFIFFDQEAVGSLGSQVWAEYYNIAKHYKEGNIVSIAKLDPMGSWDPFDPFSDRLKTKLPSSPTWKSFSTSFQLQRQWIETLLTPLPDLQRAEEPVPILHEEL